MPAFFSIASRAASSSAVSLLLSIFMSSGSPFSDFGLVGSGSLAGSGSSALAIMSLRRSRVCLANARRSGVSSGMADLAITLGTPPAHLGIAPWVAVVNSVRLSFILDCFSVSVRASSQKIEQRLSWSIQQKSQISSAVFRRCLCATFSSKVTASFWMAVTASSTSASVRPTALAILVSRRFTTPWGSSWWVGSWASPSFRLNRTTSARLLSPASTKSTFVTSRPFSFVGTLLSSFLGRVYKQVDSGCPLPTGLSHVGGSFRFGRYHAYSSVSSRMAVPSMENMG